MRNEDPLRRRYACSRRPYFRRSQAGPDGGCEIAFLHANSGAQYEFLPVHDGDNLDLGNVQIGILHTPGHTPEHISLLVTDKTRSPEPWFLLSGHTLMVGDLGRTELVSSAEEGARELIRNTPEIEITPRLLRGSAGSIFRFGLRAVIER